MAQENKSIKDALTLLQDIQLAVEEECKSLLDFVSEFAKRYEEEKRKLPYHLNIIDELHIKENAHSRILMKLLCYQNDKDEYEILQSLLEYMQKKKEAFSNIKVKKPKITQEEQRIDLWVRDEGYAIIFENKIYNAIDQEEQICRYIEKTKTEGYKVENIYVIYLSQDGKEPEEQTWGDYKEEFKDRYLNLSFRYNILPWLREHVLPNISLKDVYLKCAIKQYIDYLEGLFNLRTIQKPMIMELNDFIKENLNLNDKSPQKCLEILKKKKDCLIAEKAMLEKENKELGESYDISVDSDINLEKTKTIDGLDVFVVKWTKGNHKFNGKDLPLYKLFENEMLAEDLVRSLNGLIQLKNKFVSTDGQDNKN